MSFYTIQRNKYHKPLVCPLCGHQDIFENLVNYSSDNLNRDYINCNSCGQVFSEPFIVPDYADSDFSDIAGDYSYECYSDIGAGIESMIRPLIALMVNPIGELDSFLDVGCGFGYCVKFASILMGLRSVGYEPGEYGRIGAKVMGVDIINKYFQADSSTSKYSVIFSSEVIEHVPDPCSYLSNICSVLSKKGIAVLTTPDTGYLHKRLEELNDSDLKALALLGPGQHISLFNKESMEFLLRKIGILNYKIFEEDASLIVYFSHDLNLELFDLPKDTEVRKYYLEFLDRLLKTSAKRFGMRDTLENLFFQITKVKTIKTQEELGSRFELGIAYRLMRELVNDGDFKKAIEIQRKYESLYIRSFDITVYDALNSITPIDVEKCDSPVAILKLFSDKRISFNLYGFLFYSVNIALNFGKTSHTDIFYLISFTQRATDTLSTLFETLSNEPLALTWFGEYFRLYPRFCFGLAILYMHLDKNQDALVLLNKLLVTIDEGKYEIDSRLKPDCLLQKSVIFLRTKDMSSFYACTNTLAEEHLEFSYSSELLSTLLRKAENI